MLVLVLGLLLGRASAVAGMSTTGGEVHVAGLIVDYGDGRVAYALVPFTEPSITGFELLDRSGLSLLAIEFGGLGQGVCAIEDTGCDLDACRARMCQTGDPDSAFWQYAQQGAGGKWVPAVLGASGSTVTDGAIDAWSWSDTPPDPGAVTLEDLAARVDVDLASMRAGASTGVALATPGGDSAANNRVGRDELLAAAIVAGIATLGGVAIFRSRQRAAP